MNAPVAPKESTALQVAAPQAIGSVALLMDVDGIDRVERIADLMASGKTTIPQHLRNSKGDCFAITLQSMQWGMNPFSVAQKTHLINGTLGYESQLVAAVINNSGVIKDRFHFEWFGPWEKIIGKFKEVVSQKKIDDAGQPKKYIVPDWKQEDEHGLGIKVWATIRGESTPRELTLLLTQARTRNSTLWTEDPKQQLAYLAQKRWARLYAPDVILGVYTPDELDSQSEIHLGEAMQVGAGAPPQPATYPQTEFDVNVESWAKVITSGRKTFDDLVAMIESKAKLTEQQKTDLKSRVEKIKASTVDVRATVKPTSRAAPRADVPAASFDDVKSALEAAENLDELATAATLISAVPSDEERNYLNELYELRGQALEGQ